MKFKNCLAYHLTAPMYGPLALSDALENGRFKALADDARLSIGFAPPLAHFENGKPQGDLPLFIYYQDLYIVCVAKVSREPDPAVVTYKLNQARAAYLSANQLDQVSADWDNATRAEIIHELASDVPPTTQLFFGAFDLKHQLFYAFDSNESYADVITRQFKANMEGVRFITIRNQYHRDDFSPALTAMLLGPHLRHQPSETPKFENWKANAYLINSDFVDDVQVGACAQFKAKTRKNTIKNEDLRSFENRHKFATSSDLEVAEMELCIYDGERNAAENENQRFCVCSAVVDKNFAIKQLVISPTQQHLFIEHFESDHHIEHQLVMFAYCIRLFLLKSLPAFIHPVNIHATVE